MGINRADTPPEIFYNFSARRLSKEGGLSTGRFAGVILFLKGVVHGMKFWKKAICLFLGVAMVVPLMFGCKKEEGKDKITVCEVTHSIFYAPQYAAINLGFFEEEGIEIELSNGGGADKVMAAVLSGNIDIGLTIVHNSTHILRVRDPSL